LYWSAHRKALSHHMLAEPWGGRWLEKCVPAGKICCGGDPWEPPPFVPPCCQVGTMQGTHCACLSKALGGGGGSVGLSTGPILHRVSFSCKQHGCGGIHFARLVFCGPRYWSNRLLGRLRSTLRCGPTLSGTRAELQFSRDQRSDAGSTRM